MSIVSPEGEEAPQLTLGSDGQSDSPPTTVTQTPEETPATTVAAADQSEVRVSVTLSLESLSSWPVGCL